MFDNHFRLSARGLFTDNGNLSAPTGEEFSYRLNLTAPLGGPFVEDMIDDMAADLVAFHGRLATGIHPRAVLGEVKLARIGPDGLYTSDPAIRLVEQAGGRDGALYPPQVALAVTLETGVRGPSRRGRIFLPTPSFEVAGSYRINALQAVGVAESVATLIRDLNNAAGVDPLNYPAVTIASRKGFNTNVTEVRCGRVLDTIRSRRASLPELYPAAVAV
jgi:hypothetical protein